MVDSILPRETFQHFVHKKLSLRASRSSSPSFILKMKFIITLISSTKSCICGEKITYIAFLLIPITSFFSSANHTFNLTIVHRLMWILSTRWWDQGNSSGLVLALQIGKFSWISLSLQLNDEHMGNGWRWTCWVFCSFFPID